MKKSIIAVLVTVASAMPAMANHTVILPPEGVGTHDNKGQCQSALMRWRNERRQNPELRHHANTNDTNQEFNEAYRNNWECQETAPGVWSVVRTF